MRTKASVNPSWPGVTDSTEGRIHWRRPTAMLRFSLATLRRTIHSDNPVSQDLALGTRVESFLHHWVTMKCAVNDCVWITSCSFQHVLDFFTKFAIVWHRISAIDSE